MTIKFIEHMIKTEWYSVIDYRSIKNYYAFGSESMGVQERRAVEKQFRMDQILDAARKLLFSTGIQNISINKIAKEAELGVGTIYFYFSSKDEIFIALQEEGLSLLYLSIKKIDEKSIDPLDKLRLIAKAYYKFNTDQKDYFDILNYFLSSPQINFNKDLKNRIDMSGDKILTLIDDTLKQGIEEGFFQTHDTKKISIMFWATVHGLIQFKRFEKTILESENHEELYSYSVERLLKGLKTR